MKNSFSIFLFTFSIFHFSCKPGLEVPDPHSGNAELTKTVAVGGGFIAGYQDNALFLEGQTRSLPALLTQQFELAGGGNFVQPLMPDNWGLGLNSRPWEGNFVKRNKLVLKTDCKGVTSLSPLKTILATNETAPYFLGVSGNTMQNFGVPFGRTADLFDKNFSKSFQQGNWNPFYNRFASNVNVSTVKQDAIAQDPTFVIAWLGVEDIYEYARRGGEGVTIPSSSVFSAYLDTLLGGLTAKGAKGVIANIPELKSFPFYTLIPPRGISLDQKLADSLNTATGGIFNYIVGDNGFALEYPKSSGFYRQMGEGECILLNTPLDSVKCYKMGVFFAMPDKYTLDSSEVATINSAVAQYNSVILQKALQYNLAFADMNAYFKTVQAGIKWDGVDITAKFVSGGFFSLDGFNPHQKGYALVANEFIRAINSTYGAAIPWVNCKDCNGVKFP